MVCNFGSPVEVGALLARSGRHIHACSARGRGTLRRMAYEKLELARASIRKPVLAALIFSVAALLTGCKLNLVITSPASHGAVYERSVPVTFSLTGNTQHATFTCQLDAQAPVPCESGHVFSDLSLGRHSITVTAAADGFDTRQTAHFEVVVTDPPLEIIEPLDGETVAWSTSRGVLVRAAFSILMMPGVVMMCQIDSAPPQRCEYSVNGADPGNQYLRLMYYFANGPHSVVVSAWQGKTELATDSVQFVMHGSPH